MLATVQGHHAPAAPTTDRREACRRRDWRRRRIPSHRAELRGGMRDIRRDSSSVSDAAPPDAHAHRWARSTRGGRQAIDRALLRAASAGGAAQVRSENPRRRSTQRSIQLPSRNCCARPRAGPAVTTPPRHAASAATERPGCNRCGPDRTRDKAGACTTRRTRRCRCRRPPSREAGGSRPAS